MKMMDKGTCYDMFKEVIMDNDKPMYSNKSIEESVKYKLKVSHLTDNYRKLKLRLAIGCIKGKMFVMLHIKLIDIAKLLLLLQLEEGIEALICPELSQNGLSISLKYYDPILKIIQEKCSDSKKDYFIQDNNNSLKLI
jgi:hypothetical protein